ncbi:hypothetical protein JCM6882_009586 [Rhodosporidiobolus microsporus]
MSSFWQPDATSVVLATLIVIALAVGFYLRPPPPLVHPFLLGRQSTPAPTRNEGESSVYVNSATTGGVRSPFRPDRAVRSLDDVLGKSETCLDGGAKGTWVKGGEKVVDLVKALRAGLLSKLAGVEGKVLVAVEDPTDALLVTLALATSPLKPVVIAPGSAIPSGLDVVAAVQTASESLTSSESPLPAGAKVILLGEEHQEEAYEILASGKTQAVEASAAEPSDVALTIVSEGVPLELTHQNLTSSLVSWLSLFPASPQATKPAIKDYIVSFHHPSTPYGLGLALLVIYQSSGFGLFSLPQDATPDDFLAVFDKKNMPPATLLFGSSDVLVKPLYTSILKEMLGDMSFLIQHARNSKMRLLREGTISKQTWGDSLLWAGVRKDLYLSFLRGVFISGPLEQSRLDTCRIALGCPTVSTLEHPFLLAPLSAGNMWDFQRLPPPGVKEIDGREKCHVGAPTIGVEVKLRGEERDFESGRVRGEVVIRTPLLPLPSSLPSSLLLTDETLPPLPAYPDKPAPTQTETGKWLRTGVKAEMSTEGTLWLEEEEK